GKTVLAKGIALGLGITEQVVSPTYTIVSEYTTGRRPLHHVDLYRIEGSEQLENLGLEDIMAGNGIVLIEWGEKLAAGPAAAPDAARVHITLAADGGRDIVAEGLPR
ncbi:MAG: tRNA (adenosine(37)-N6)-threonylcarbamoyltransferase complex ATPase subunit type 1 TsaE, partial [Spirochaetia bacterium]